MKEPFLEPFLRRIRVNKVMPTILRYPDCRLLDIGCGWDYRLLKTVEPFIGSGVGIDFNVRETESAKIKTVQMRMGGGDRLTAVSIRVIRHRHHAGRS